MTSVESFAIRVDPKAVWALQNEDSTITPTKLDLSSHSPFVLGGLALISFIGIGMFLRKR